MASDEARGDHIRARDKFLTFRLASETYGADILTVREIIALAPITPVPNTPTYIRGVVNLRGKIIPVLDLRLKFGMQAPAATAETCIVVFEIHPGGRTLLIGAWVDSVREVIAVEPGAIEPPPSFGVQVDTAYLRGLVRTPGGVCLLLHIEKVLTQDDHRTVAELNPGPATSEPRS
ncbi:MAG: chemotaxis protein CheW [Planctomycetota bacterium]